MRAGPPGAELGVGAPSDDSWGSTQQDPNTPATNRFAEAQQLFEKTMIKKLANYETILEEATRDLAPHKLATYLYDTAQEFSRFYENCPVAGSENEDMRRKIVENYLKVITHGLNLLGIEVPERM